MREVPLNEVISSGNESWDVTRYLQDRILCALENVGVKQDL